MEAFCRASADGAWHGRRWAHLRNLTPGSQPALLLGIGTDYNRTTVNVGTGFSLSSAYTNNAANGSYDQRDQTIDLDLGSGGDVSPPRRARRTSLRWRIGLPGGFV